jgi:5'-3' exonuclease
MVTFKIKYSQTCIQWSKKYAWQGVALLPFVDEKRLLGALESVYPDLTPEEGNTPNFTVS